MPVNGINQDQEYAFQSSEFMSLSYLLSDGNWRIVPGVMDYNISGGSTPSRDVVAANTAVAKRVGRPRVGDVSISAYFMPTDYCVALSFVKHSWIVLWCNGESKQMAILFGDLPNLCHVRRLLVVGMSHFIAMREINRNRHWIIIQSVGAQ